MKSQRIAPLTVLVISLVALPHCGPRASSTGPIPGGELSTPPAPRDATRVAGQPAPPPMPGTPHYDVVLEVPELSVEEIELNVTGLLARVALDANAANLVAISAGAVASLDRVRVGLYGIDTEAYLYADLDNVGHIVRRVVKTLDKNPQILTRLLVTADSLVNVVGNVANTTLQPGGVVSQTVGALGNTLTNVTQPDGLLSQSVNQLGQTLQQVVTQTGTVVERTLDATGRLLDERTIATVLSLPVVQEANNTLGQTVRTVRTATGSLIEVTLDQAGNLLSANKQGGAVLGGVGAVGQTLQTVTAQVPGLLSQVTNTLGQTVQQLVSTTGTITERTLDATGKLVNERTLGSVLNLPVVGEVTNTLGQTVRTVRSTSGSLIDVTLDKAGKVVGTKVQQQGDGAAGAAGGVVSAVGQTLQGVTAQVPGLLSQVTNTLGQTVQQFVTETGTILERTLDTTGKVLSERTVASALKLPVVQEVTNTLGQKVRTVRSASGSLIDVTLDQAGNVIGAKAQQQTGAAGVLGGVVGQTLQNVTPLVTGLLSQVTNTVGQLVQQVVTQNGSILQRTLDATGKVLDTRTLGSVLDLPLVRQGANDAGQPIRVVRDPIGNLIEATLAPAGNVIGCRVVQRVSL